MAPTAARNSSPCIFIFWPPHSVPELCVPVPGRNSSCFKLDHCLNPPPDSGRCPYLSKTLNADASKCNVCKAFYARDGNVHQTCLANVKQDLMGWCSIRLNCAVERSTYGHAAPCVCADRGAPAANSLSPRSMMTLHTAMPDPYVCP